LAHFDWLLLVAGVAASSEAIAVSSRMIPTAPSAVAVQ
jgi:hypothetical protein